MHKSEKIQSDVLIYGATPGGIACAIRAAREGLSVSLVSYFEHLGGMWVNGVQILDTLYEGFRTPFLNEFLTKVQNYYKEKYGKDSALYKATLFGDRSESFAHPCFEPHVAEFIFKKLLESEAGIVIYKKFVPIEANLAEKKIKEILFKKDGSDETYIFHAKVFVDASYEGDLAAVTGVPYRIGREDRNEYGEKYAGKIFGKRITGLFPFEAKTGRLNLRCFKHTTGQLFAGSTGEADSAIQSYNARLTLSFDPDNRISINRPQNYDRATFLPILSDGYSDISGQYPLKSQLILEKLSLELVGLQGAAAHSRDGLTKIYGWNAGNYPGQNWDYPEVDWAQRNIIKQAHVEHALGLLYFLQNDKDVPREIRKRARQWGLAKDEYADNNHIPYEIYVREGRRYSGRYIFTEHDVLIEKGIHRTPIHDDSIAISDWYIDIHDCSTERKPGSENDGVIMITEESRPAQIPYRTLLPENIDNLLITVCLSSSHVGWGSIRTEPTLVHIGEAAGFAAAQAIRMNENPSDIQVIKLQKTLVENGVMISMFNEFDMKTQKRWIPAIQFFGTKGFFKSYDAKPDGPIDVLTANNWIKKIGELLFENYLPPKLENQTKAVVDENKEIDSASEFIQMIKRIFISRSKNIDFSFFDSYSIGDEKITRGEVCFLLYEMFKNLNYFEFLMSEN